ncbi:hypothetical protein [Denitrovibrio acetiphilus]|nr:hypothetical protein [Denitrovibrio acetiphilus]
MSGCTWLTAKQPVEQSSKQEYRPAYWYELKEGKQYHYPTTQQPQSEQRSAYWYEIKEGKQYWYPK